DFLDAPKDTIALFREAIPAAKAPNAGEFRKLVTTLGSANFRERDQATAALKALGPNAEAALRAHIKTEKSLDVRRRLEVLHDALLKSPSWQRTERAVDILAALPRDVAAPLLRDLAKGDTDAVLTQKSNALVRP